MIQSKQAGSRLTAWLWILVATVPLAALYLRTMLPGVGRAADTARFQFVGKVWGTPHPTGYPLYTVLNHFFVTLLPVGSLPWRANLLSAVFSVAAAGVFFRLLVLLGASRVVAAATALLLGCTPTLWSQSVAAEVYTLNLLFVVLVLYYFLRWRRLAEDRAFYVATAIYALSFGHHLTMVTLLPALIYIVWRTDARAFREPRKIAWVALVVVLGALQYGYLFWRTLDPTTVYLESHASNLRSLWETVSGAQNKAKMFSTPLSEVVRAGVPEFLGGIWRELGPLLILAAAGVFYLRDRATARFLCLCALGTLVFALNYAILDIHVYYIPFYLVVTAFVGLGLQGLMEHWPRVKWLGPALFLLPAAAAALHFGAMDQSGNTAEARKVEEVLRLAGSNALILVQPRAQARFYQVYLLGEGMQSRGLFVTGDEAAVETYLARGGQVVPPSQTVTVPAGLPVYAVDGAGPASLQRQHWNTGSVYLDRLFAPEREAGHAPDGA